MNYKQFQELQKQEFNFLDTLKLESYFKNEIEIRDIMNKIEDAHGNKYTEDFIFNCITDEEFIEYLQKRYPYIIFDEVVSYKLRYIEK